jgi:hypothetical protein
MISKDKNINADFLYYAIAIIVVVCVLTLYNKGCENFTNNILKNKPNKEKEQEQEKEKPKKSLSLLKSGKVPITIKRSLLKQKVENDLAKCVRKLREKPPSSFVKGTPYETNEMAFNLNDMKHDEDDNNKRLKNTKKMARLNCKYFDLDNDAINQQIIPKQGELFVV